MDNLYEITDIYKLRRALGMSQRELAEASGVSQSLIAKIEGGRIDPGYSKMKRIFDTLENAKQPSHREAAQIMTVNVVSVQESSLLKEAIALMHRKEISQLPVLKGNEIVGSLTDKKMVDIMASGKPIEEIVSKPVQVYMDPAFPTVDPNAPIDMIAKLLSYYSAVLVMHGGSMVGIITRSDILMG